MLGETQLTPYKSYTPLHVDMDQLKRYPNSVSLRQPGISILLARSIFSVSVQKNPCASFASFCRWFCSHSQEVYNWLT